jgi:hypothetical protein
LAFPKAQFWNMKFTKSEPACNLIPLLRTDGCDRIARNWQSASKQIRASPSVYWVAKADALCRPGVATVPEQVMGSVDSTILGSKSFADIGLSCARDGRAPIGVAIIAVVEIAAVSGPLASACERNDG